VTLVERIRRGDPRALTTAYEELRPRVFGFLLRLTRRRPVAEELLQDVFLKLAAHATRLDEDTDLAAWLFTVARNAWISYRRWAALDLGRYVAIDDRDFPDRAYDEAHYDARRRLAGVERALATLPDHYREVLLLCAIEGFDHERAATVLELKPDAVRQRLSRARKLLEQALIEVRAHALEVARA
jgi:RNA polymerase sigma factor (sigma-70 family)